MSVTILQYPQVLMPAYNDIVFTVDSDNKSECEFRYICDIYVENIFVERLKLFPDPINGYASFKINGVLQDYLSYDLHQNLYGSSLFSTNNNTCKLYSLKFGEEYDNSSQCDAGTIVYQNLTVTGSYYAFNAALQYAEWLDWDYTNYEASSVLSKFLTTTPDKVLITTGSQMTFNFVNSLTVDKLQVKTYNSVSTLIGTYLFDNSTSFTSSQSRILTMGVGPENLNNSTLLSGSQPVINASVSYYTVQLLDASNVALSELKRIDIDNRATVFNKHRFWWLNKLGGFDSYDYSMKDKLSVDSSRTFYNKLIGKFTSASPNGTWDYNIGDRGKTVLSVNSNESRVFNSNWLTEKESIWMRDLFSSLEVYLSSQNDVNKFCILSYSFDNDTGLYSVTIPIKGEYEIGENIFVDFGIGNNFSYLSGSYIVDFINNGFITIELGVNCVEFGSPPTCLDLGDYVLDGSVFILNYNSKLDPVIIKSTTYEEKIKYRNKNIDYQIELEPSYSINTQRN